MSNFSEGHLRIDKFLPEYDFAATYDIRINAAPAVVYECLFWLDFNEVWIVRLLETLRTGKLIARSHVPTDLRQRLKDTGFVMLTEAPNEELVMGIAGQFWRPDGGRCIDVTANDFVGFARPGYAKAAWNFSLRSDLLNKTVLLTETRIRCFGSTARWKFRIYWSLIYPFAGLIRKAILRRVKREAELKAAV